MTSESVGIIFLSNFGFENFRINMLQNTGIDKKVLLFPCF